MRSCPTCTRRSSSACSGRRRLWHATYPCGYPLDEGLDSGWDQRPHERTEQDGYRNWNCAGGYRIDLADRDDPSGLAGDRGIHLGLDTPGCWRYRGRSLHDRLATRRDHARGRARRSGSSCVGAVTSWARRPQGTCCLWGRPFSLPGFRRPLGGRMTRGESMAKSAMPKRGSRSRPLRSDTAAKVRVGQMPMEHSVVCRLDSRSSFRTPS